MVRYLSAFEATNDLPVDSVSGHLGWVGDGFSLGREYLGGGRPVAFRGADDGDERLADALSSAGDFEAWREAVKSILPYPRAALGLYASLAAPVLKVLDAPSFVVDFSGSTSTGKTTVLRLAASVWGNPEPGSGILRTWNSTRVYIERASAVLHDLPLILDDTKGVKHPNLVAQTIYDYTTGQGRGRGCKVGLGASSSWRGVLIPSGEQKATSFTQDAGQHAHVLALWGSPFGGPNAEVVNGLVRVIRSDYGHAGPQFVRFLLEHHDEWPDYCKEHNDARWRYAEKAAGNPVAARLADNLATLNLTAALASRALGLPYSDPIEPLYEDLMREAAEADKPKEAIIAALSWATSRSSTFYGRHRETPEGKPTEPYGGWNGRWDANEGYSFIAFGPVNLKTFLSSVGFHPDSILRSWKDRGWLETDGDDSRLTKKIRLGSTSTRMIYVKRSAVSEVGMG
jgi:putative DNA primase/helicase